MHKARRGNLGSLASVWPSGEVVVRRLHCKDDQPSNKPKSLCLLKQSCLSNLAYTQHKLPQWGLIFILYSHFLYLLWCDMFKKKLLYLIGEKLCLGIWQEKGKWIVQFGGSCLFAFSSFSLQSNKITQQQNEYFIKEWHAVTLISWFFAQISNCLCMCVCVCDGKVYLKSTLYKRMALFFSAKPNKNDSQRELISLMEALNLADKKLKC